MNTLNRSAIMQSKEQVEDMQELHALALTDTISRHTGDDDELRSCVEFIRHIDTKYATPVLMYPQNVIKLSDKILSDPFSYGACMTYAVHFSKYGMPMMAEVLTSLMYNAWAIATSQSVPAPTIQYCAATIRAHPHLILAIMVALFPNATASVLAPIKITPPKRT